MGRIVQRGSGASGGCGDRGGVAAGRAVRARLAMLSFVLLAAGWLLPTRLMSSPASGVASGPVVGVDDVVELMDALGDVTSFSVSFRFAPGPMERLRDELRVTCASRVGVSALPTPFGSVDSFVSDDVLLRRFMVSPEVLERVDDSFVVTVGEESVRPAELLGVWFGVRRDEASRDVLSGFAGPDEFCDFPSLVTWSTPLLEPQAALVVDGDRFLLTAADGSRVELVTFGGNVVSSRLERPGEQEIYESVVSSAGVVEPTVPEDVVWLSPGVFGALEFRMFTLPGLLEQEVPVDAEG